MNRRTFLFGAFSAAAATCAAPAALVAPLPPVQYVVPSIALSYDPLLAVLRAESLKAMMVEEDARFLAAIRSAL